MDENKKVVNNDENLNNMDYSFDFANQVDNNEATSNDLPVASETPAMSEEPVTPVTPETPVMPEEPVTPVTPESLSTSETSTLENEEDDVELIKDKKETKRFLIILFVLLIAFIIALPFIFKVAG